MSIKEDHRVWSYGRHINITDTYSVQAQQRTKRASSLQDSGCML